MCCWRVQARLLDLPLIHYILASAVRLFTVEFVSFGFGLHESVAGVCGRVGARACVRCCAFVCVCKCRRFLGRVEFDWVWRPLLER
jgi:hypothetical protein